MLYIEFNRFESDAKACGKDSGQVTAAPARDPVEDMAHDLAENPQIWPLLDYELLA